MFGGFRLLPNGTMTCSPAGKHGGFGAKNEDCVLENSQKSYEDVPIDLPISEETKIIDSDEDQLDGFRINWSFILAVLCVALYMLREKSGRTKNDPIFTPNPADLRYL